MNIKYSELTYENLDDFIAMRIKGLSEQGNKDLSYLKPDLQKYFEKHLNDKTFIGITAFDNDKIIATGGISIVEKPPYEGCENGKIALLSCMYTLKEYRRMGIARNILALLSEKAKENDCSVIQITASDMGVLLYTSFGFVKNNNFMQYTLK